MWRMYAPTPRQVVLRDRILTGRRNSTLHLFRLNEEAGMMMRAAWGGMLECCGGTYIQVFVDSRRTCTVNITFDNCSAVRTVLHRPRPLPLARHSDTNLRRLIEMNDSSSKVLRSRFSRLKVYSDVQRRTQACRRCWSDGGDLYGAHRCSFFAHSARIVGDEVEVSVQMW